MTEPADLHRLLGTFWPTILEHVDNALLVLDESRMLRYVNDPARRLLGYAEDEEVGGRCRLTTHGQDCEHACPLSFAIAGAIDRVESFATVYHAKDGSPLLLSVTVIPLLEEDGTFRGAVEILRPAEPDLGFLLAGRSATSQELRRRVAEAARSGCHLVLLGEPPVAADVALTIHRLSGMSEELFHTWPGDWGALPAWPPGTVFAAGAAGGDLFRAPPPPGWRVIVGIADRRDHQVEAAVSSQSFQLLELPQAADLGDDLPLVVADWLTRLAPRTAVAPEALARLSRIARELGLARLEGVLLAAVAAAGARLEESHIPEVGYQTAYLDELLRQPDPLTALEERLLREVVERSGWRMQEAADRLRISRVTLWRKLRDHGIARPENESGT